MTRDPSVLPVRQTQVPEVAHGADGDGGDDVADGAPDEDADAVGTVDGGGGQSMAASDPSSSG